MRHTRLQAARLLSTTMAPQSRGASKAFHTHAHSLSLSPQPSSSDNEDSYRNEYLARQVVADLSSEGEDVDISEEDDDDDDEMQLQSQRRQLSQQSSPTPAAIVHREGIIKSPSAIHNHPSFLNSTFAPPFYNRPPTPLPPSPSLTSLLRPPFSAATSRPTTPSDSDVDSSTIPASNAPEAAVARSAKKATRVPRASPKVPTYEYYGFVLYIGSSLVFLMYTLWSFLPAPFLHGLGIDYYPNRWWSLALPAWLVMSIIWIYVALASYNTGYLTLKMDSIENVVDEKGSVATKERMIILDDRISTFSSSNKQRNKDEQDYEQKHGDEGFEETDWRELWAVSTDAVLDIPIGGVCEVLYGAGRGPDPELTHKWR